ncbi:hypothetical protein CIB95_01345 [Lottiidibacillus patelloidae]|uniref:Hydrolase n=1 Tax=Lottiidibacillus patelloidae TaxID=2670334 RepID=A0A263BYK0_9BACI|nr:hypothetical protein [Lottiidibacillus patelloidae]OZM58246.1 hypothetical protein CIB95_01345 [Lottiidibacillus patelloidae]
MCIKERYFMIEDQWNIIHLPHKPNGFGVMIIGDTNHYVDKRSSLWMQNSERRHLIQDLLDKGYTVFYSNLFGRHWGSKNALDVSVKLYHHVMKNEILNKKIHLLVEGMGGLLALKLMETLGENIRSTVMINPCLFLKAHFNREKTNKLFYKRLKREISIAYEVDEKEVEGLLNKDEFSCENLKSEVPTKIWHAASGSKYLVSDHSRCYESFRKLYQSPIDLSLHLADGRFSFSKQITRFFKTNEKVL